MGDTIQCITCDKAYENYNHTPGSNYVCKNKMKRQTVIEETKFRPVNLEPENMEHFKNKKKQIEESTPCSGNGGRSTVNGS